MTTVGVDCVTFYLWVLAGLGLSGAAGAGGKRRRTRAGLWGSDGEDHAASGVLAERR